MTYDGRPNGYLDRLEAMAHATAADVRDAARRWLDAPHYTLRGHAVPAADGRHRRRIDRTVLPPLGDAPDVTFPEVQRATLANGLSVMLLERHSAPLVNVALAVDAGYAADSAERAGAASLALDLLDDGTTTRDTFRIADELDALGARITTASSLDLSFVRLQALPSENLAPVAGRLRRRRAEPLVPRRPCSRIQKERRLAQIAQEKAQPTRRRCACCPACSSAPATPTASRSPARATNRRSRPLTRDDLARWHRAWFHPGNAHAHRHRRHDDGSSSCRSSSGRSARGRPARRPPSAIQLGAARRRAGASTSSTSPARRSRSSSRRTSRSRAVRPRTLAIDTVMRNFGGIATSRLNRNLRLDKHWSYGTQGVHQRCARAAAVHRHRAGADRQDEGVDRRSDEGDSRHRRRAPDGRRRVREHHAQQTLGLPARFATLAALEAAALQLLNYGYPDDYFSTYATACARSNETQLDAAAKKFIRPAR